jgi:hypothetical protein
MKEPWGQTLLQMQNQTAYNLVESLDEVQGKLDGAAKEVAENDGSPFVRFTSVTGYFPPVPVTVNTMYVISVITYTQSQWETQVASNRKHYAAGEKAAREQAAGFGT